MPSLPDLEVLASLPALVGLEIILGIDNIVFIAIMVEALPREQRRVAYRLGLAAALMTRLALLFTLSWMMRLTTPVVTVLDHAVSGRDLILLAGGVFLVFKSSKEMFDKVERTEEREGRRRRARAGLAVTVVQIMVLDIVFSLDSVITALGIARVLWAMATAMVVAVMVMMLFARAVGEFVTKNPSMQVLALAFLMLVGVLLVAEAFGQKVSKATIYFAMGFALLVELMQLRRRKKILDKLDPPGD